MAEAGHGRTCRLAHAAFVWAGLALALMACSGAGTGDAGVPDALGADGDCCPGPDLNPTEGDRDGDGIPDEVEDKNENGVVDAGETDPDNPDTDGDGVIDGVEDGNHNGQVDWGESDPLNPDTDGDGIPDGTEDRNGNGEVDANETDPLKADSDRDGIPDGVEDRNLNGNVDAGETDPTRMDTDGDGLSDSAEDRNGNRIVDPDETSPINPDMDGDGVLDGDEDHNGDGQIGTCTTPCSSDAQCAQDEVCATRSGVCYSSACSMGETDPFDPDTDGDGVPDGAEASTLVCSAENLKVVNFHDSEPASFQLALETFFDTLTSLADGGLEVGIMVHDSGHDIAGFLLSRTPSGGSAAAQEAADRAVIAGTGTMGAATSRALTTFDGHKAVIAEYDLNVDQKTAPELGNQLVLALHGAGLTGTLPPGGAPGGNFRMFTETVYRNASQAIVVGTVSSKGSLNEGQILRMNDVTNSTALAGYTDQTKFMCESFLSKGVNPVDFIWVVDNSESMGEEQAAVAAAGQAMGDLLLQTTLVWRVGVTRSDAVYDGLLWSGFIAHVNRFQNDIIEQGTGGSPLERSLEMGLRALDHSLPCTPDGQPEDQYKLRCGATRIVVVLTDEDDETIEEQSGGENYPGDPDADIVDQFIRAYRDRDAILFAIAGGNPRCGAAALNPSKGINAVVHGIGWGSVGSICNPDQTQNVQNIIRAASGVSSTYRLSRPAISATLKVATVPEPGAAPVEVPRSRSNGFDYDGVTNAVLFYGTHRPPVDDLDVVVSYRYFVDCIPEPEECDFIDNDCDGQTDEDFDGDGDGWTLCGGDCDDGDPDTHPGAEELCDGKDNDCDGDIDEGWDQDGDGFRVCDDDCDDNDDTVFPGAPELCDGKDNDCDGEIDPDWACG